MVGFKRERDNALRMEGNEKTVLGKEEGTMDDGSYYHHVIHHYLISNLHILHLIAKYLPIIYLLCMNKQHFASNFIHTSETECAI